MSKKKAIIGAQKNESTCMEADNNRQYAQLRLPYPMNTTNVFGLILFTATLLHAEKDRTESAEHLDGVVSEDRAKPSYTYHLKR